MGGGSGAASNVAASSKTPQRWVDTNHHPQVDGVNTGTQGPSPQPGGSGTMAIATWNIRSGRNGGLEVAAQALDQMGVGVAVVQETKVMDGKHTRCTSGYKVIALSTPSWRQGGIALLWKDENAAFKVEVARIRMTNVLTFQLVTGST